MRKQCWTLALLPVFMFNAQAADYYVSAKAQENGEGTKEVPFKSLSHAIETAATDDVIYLTEGSYLPDIPEEDSRKATFKIDGKVLTIIGGYNEGFTQVTGRSLLTADVNGDDRYDEATGLLVENYADNCTRVMTVTKNGGATLKNLTLQGGYADMTSDKLDTGGGMYIGGPVTMDNVVITGNYCKNSAGGGGICCKGDLTADNCLFYGNQGGGDGGAVYIKNKESHIAVSNSVFRDNLSTSGSAVFYSEAASCFFSGNTFENNSSKTYGTFTAYNNKFEGVITLVNNTFANNKVSGNNDGKARVGGAGVYAHLKENGVVHMINNTVAGNFVEGYTADQTVSDKLGGAVYAREGKLFLANNIIAGNKSASGYGDLYKDEKGIINSKEYNFYTASENINITPERNDIVAGIDRATGMNKLTEVLDCTYADEALTAHCTDNGGKTPTVKIIGEDVAFDGLTVRSVPVENLQETALDVDVNNDGEKTGSLLYDQRGTARNQSGSACIGAYELDGKTLTKLPFSAFDCRVWQVGRQLVIDCDEACQYTVYTLSGRETAVGMVTPGQAVQLGELPAGCYVVNVKSGNNAAMNTSIKVIL